MPTARQRAAANTTEADPMEAQTTESEQPKPEVVEAGPADTSGKTEAELKREAYSAAETRLRNEYQDRFRELVIEEAGKRGVQYTFKKTPEEKAAEQMKALLEQFPDLRQQVAGA